MCKNETVEIAENSQRRRSNHLGNFQAKGPYIITLERRLSLTEGVNLSGNKTEGVYKELLWKHKKQLYTNIIKV